jgi:hypothetical protein
MISRPPIFSTPTEEILDFPRRAPRRLNWLDTLERAGSLAHLHCHGVVDDVACLSAAFS